MSQGQRLKVATSAPVRSASIKNAVPPALVCGLLAVLAGDG